jgi:FlaA1/EpsC-like NDP-sugar epimerase
VRITDLARDLIVLSGKDPAEIEIKFTGLRPGEKLFEELITAGEGVLETGHDKIMVLGSGTGAKEQPESLEALLAAARCFDAGGVKRILKRLVPEYGTSPGGSVPRADA